MIHNGIVPDEDPPSYSWFSFYIPKSRVSRPAALLLVVRLGPLVRRQRFVFLEHGSGLVRQCLEGRSVPRGHCSPLLTRPAAHLPHVRRLNEKGRKTIEWIPPKASSQLRSRFSSRRREEIRERGGGRGGWEKGHGDRTYFETLSHVR